MTGPGRRRGRSTAVLAGLVGSAGALLSATQPWLTITVADAPLTVTGANIQPVLQPLALAGMALALVLALVGLVLRYVLGVLQVAIGAVVVIQGVDVLLSPTAGDATAVVTEHTGIAGQAAADLVSGLAVTLWPVAGLLAGVLVVFAGGWSILTARHWARGGRRYQDPSDARSRDSEHPGRLDAIDSWDDLSRGTDPT